MKKIIAIVLALTVIFAFAACGGKKTPTDAQQSSYADSVEVFTKVFDAYTEENKFPVGGGDEANMSMEKPAKYDIALTDELSNVAAFPASQAENIEDAATAIHMMMANNFSAGAYKLKDGADVKAFADEYVAGLDGRQWMCGMPEKYVVVSTGNFVITAYGLGNIIEYFKTTASAALENAQVLAEGDIKA